MKKRFCLMGGLFLCLGTLIFGAVVSGGQAAAGGGQAALEGVFHILWGDGQPAAGLTQTRYFLTNRQFGTVQLQVSLEMLAQAGGWFVLNGQTLTVDGRWLTPAQDGGVFEVESLALAHQPDAPQDVIGSQPWVSILCKFSDIPDEPKALSYFVDMFSSAYPGLDHYWREQSYNLVNLQGSGAFGWYTLPRPRSYYVPSSGYMNWWLAAQDCAGVADADVYFPDFVGINLMFNYELDGYAWGGSWYTTLDGVTRTWRATWEPPWGYGNVGVIAHENGHGFGLPHSNWGDIGYVYDNEWDVMSDLWANNSSHPIYGTLGQHTISFHKAMLGWIPQSQIVTVVLGQMRTVTLERLALPTTASALAVRVPINGAVDYFYTIEARQQVGNYDIGLPGNAVIIHEVLTSRSDAPAFLMGTNGGLGGAWTPGETFTDAAHGIEITVVSATASGFVVTVRNQFEEISAVDLAGPAQAYLGDSVALTATVSPAEATLPITYTWQASGQEPLTCTGGLVDTAQFQWSEPGMQMITVTVNNGAGSFSDTHTVLILPLRVAIDGPQEILAGQPFTFTATSILYLGEPPITYTWQASDFEPVTHTGGLVDTAQFFWTEPGTQTVSVTAQAGGFLDRTVYTVTVQVMGPHSMVLDGLSEVSLAEPEYRITAYLFPFTTTLPVTYAWQVDGVAVLTQTGSLSDTLAITWVESGMHTITVTAYNDASLVQATQDVVVYRRIYLPFAVRGQ